jgi:hypothetical protein
MTEPRERSDSLDKNLGRQVQKILFLHFSFPLILLWKKKQVLLSKKLKEKKLQA